MTIQAASARSPRDGRTRAVQVLLAFIILLGMSLRFTGIGWSLPDRRHPLATYHPDERVNLTAALQSDIVRGQFDIKFYNYGTFYFYLVDLAQTIGRGYGQIPATPQSAAALPPEERMRAQAPEYAGLYLAGRIVTALLGTATIPVLFALGSRMFGRRAGLFAALFYAAAPLAALHAHFLTVDVPATFFVTLCLMQSARLLTIPTWREYALAAVWAGLAAATKYNAGLVLIAPIAAHFLNSAPDACRKHRAAQLVALLAVAAIAFLIACPGPWLNFDAFWNGIDGWPGSGLRYELFEHSRQGHGYLFTDTGPGWWYHLRMSLRCGLGLPLLLLAGGGVLLAFARRTREDRVLLAFLLLYYITTSFSAVRFARYMLPLFPVLCLLAARAATAFGNRKEGTACLVLGAAAAACTLMGTFVLISPLQSVDPRDRVADDLEKSARPGATVAFATVPWFYSPPLSPRFGELAAPARAAAGNDTTRFTFVIPPSEWDTSVLAPAPDYVVLSTLETADVYSRLRLPGPTAFMTALKAGPFTPRNFVPMMATSFVSFTGEDIPQDMLYTQPTLTLYSKR